MSPATTDVSTEPVATFRAGRGISAAVFPRKSEKGASYFPVSVQKRYKDKTGEWKTSTSFLKDELPALRHVTDQAYGYVVENNLSAEE